MPLWRVLSSIKWRSVMVKVNIHSGSVSISRMVGADHKIPPELVCLGGNITSVTTPETFIICPLGPCKALDKLVCTDEAMLIKKLAGRYVVVWLKVCDETKVSTNLCLATVLYGPLLKRTSVVVMDV